MDHIPQFTYFASVKSQRKRDRNHIISLLGIPISYMLPVLKAKHISGNIQYSRFVLLEGNVHSILCSCYDFRVNDPQSVFLFPTKRPHKVHNIFIEANHLCSLGTVDWTRQTWVCLMWRKPSTLRGLGNISAQQWHTERRRQWNSVCILNDVEQPILERTGLESTVTAQLPSHTCKLFLLEQTLITKDNLQLIIRYNLNEPIQLKFPTSAKEII